MSPFRPGSTRPGPAVLVAVALTGAAGLALVPAGAATAAGPVAPADGAVPAGAPTESAALSAVPAGGALRMVPETRGSGRRQRLVTRVDVVAPDGAQRRLPTLRDTGLDVQPGLAPDGRSFAVVRQDGRIAVVAVRDGRVRLLTPPDLPDLSAARGPNGWSAGAGAETIRWAPSGRSFTVARLLSRGSSGLLPRTVTRSVSCTLRTARCSTAGPGAPADLVPLSRGGLLRLDGPLTWNSDDGSSSTSGFSAAGRRSILKQARRPVVTAASAVGAGGDTRVLRSVISTGRRGVVSFESQAFPGGAGVLVRRTRTRVSPDRPDDGSGLSDEPSLLVSTRTLRPWLVSPAGRVRTFGRSLGVDPIGTLPDGRWIMPVRAVGPARNSEEPEPELAALDARGRVQGLPVGGRPVTPVRLALEAGLPDPFAVGARFDAAVVRGRELVVTLAYSGAGGIVFGPPDRAVVRIALDGSAPARTIDQEDGATYVVR